MDPDAEERGHGLLQERRRRPAARGDDSAEGPEVPASAPLGASRRWGLVVLSAWLALHLLWVFRALLPGAESVSRRLPWNMFSNPRTTTTEVLAVGQSAAGESVEIPLRDYFRFARGSTEQRVYATSRFLLLPGHDDERRAFAEWLAERMARGGQPVDEVVLLRRDRRIVDGRVREREIGRFATPAERKP
ncbi:MAG: hypothetical protein KC420_18275 [Myxococcales bacterium]|nr:hypothetical protein [Myxococcales bacterium]